MVLHFEKVQTFNGLSKTIVGWLSISETIIWCAFMNFAINCKSQSRKVIIVFEEGNFSDRRSAAIILVRPIPFMKDTISTYLISWNRSNIPSFIGTLFGQC